MNLRLLYEIQNAIFRIIFILFGLYLILVLIKEIFLLFIPCKDVKIIDSRVQAQSAPDTSIKKVDNTEYVKFIVDQNHPLIKQLDTNNKIVYNTPSSPSPIKKKVKRRKSRRSKK